MKSYQKRIYLFCMGIIKKITCKIDTIRDCRDLTSFKHHDLKQNLLPDTIKPFVLLCKQEGL